MRPITHRTRVATAGTPEPPASWERGHPSRVGYGELQLFAGWKPALVWSAPHLQGGSGAGKQVQLHTCIRPLWWERFGSRALMGSAHTSPHLPDGLERAQRGLRLVACRSDLSCHRLHFPSQRLASSCSPRWLALGGPGSVVVRRVRRARSDIHGLSTGAGPLTRPSAGGQAVDIAPSLMAPLSSRSGPTYAGSTRYSCSRTSSAQAVRAVLFANATAAMFAPRRPCTDTAQRLRRSSRLAAARNAARAP